MPSCWFAGCNVKIQTGYFCREHYDVLLERSMNHLDEADARFLLGHFDGCTAEVVAEHLGVSVDAIDHLLTYPMESMVFGGPLQHLNQRQLIRVLLRQDGLRYFDEERARREAREASLDDWEPSRRVRDVEPVEKITLPESSVSQEPETIVSSEPKPELEEAEEREVSVEPVEKVAAEALTEVDEPWPKSHYNRAEGELTAWDVACLLETYDVTVRNWMIEGLLSYEERPLGSKGRKMRVTKLEHVIAFVRSCFGNYRFARYGERFTRFLQKHVDNVSV